MTEKEAKGWLDHMDEPKLIKMIMEYDTMKQALCARTLSIPTGTDDWLERSILRAQQLRECEIQLRVLINTTSAALEQASWMSLIRTCTNCMGRKTTGKGDEECSCAICGGTGLRRL
jgi:hypothetical protein